MTAVIAGERHADGQDRQLVLLEGVGDARCSVRFERELLDHVRLVSKKGKLHGSGLGGRDRHGPTKTLGKVSSETGRWRLEQ